MLTPVLPPTAASTMPSTEVGTCTTRTPRSQHAATKPARSVTAPPPTPTIASVRVNPAAASSSQHRAATSIDLPASASGTSMATPISPAAASTSAIWVASVAQRFGVQHRDPGRAGHQRRQMTGEAEADQHVVRLLAADVDRRDVGHARAQHVQHERGHLFRRAPVGVHGDGRDLFVERSPLVEQEPQGGTRVDRQQRAAGVQTDALDRVGQSDRQVDHGVAGKQLPVRGCHAPPRRRARARRHGRRAPPPAPCSPARGSALRRRR